MGPARAIADRAGRSLALLLALSFPVALAMPADAQVLERRGTAADRPARPALDPAAQRAIEAEWLDPAERRAARIFHGVWDATDLVSPDERAQAALLDGRFLDPIFDSIEVDPLLRGEALFQRGAFGEVLLLLVEAADLRGLRLRCESLEQLGRIEEALDELDGNLPALAVAEAELADGLVESARLLLLRARLVGQPARDYQRTMALLARARGEIDRLHWPARLLEAALLLDKDNPEEAEAALRETLALNPRAAEAWRFLGRVAVDRFDFAATENAMAILRGLDPAHPWADLLEARMWLVRNDPAAAEALVEGVLARAPHHAEALFLRPAVEAARYDFDAMMTRLAELDERFPGGAEGWLETGRRLSLDRQYPEAAAILEEAVRRRPAWPAPRIELAMLEMQSGRDALALQALEEVARIDPFNTRSANALALLREIAGYERIRTRFFELRYRPGIDAVVAALMPMHLDAMHEEVAGRFAHEPAIPTVIELLPDHPSFAVRITGMPWIHTVAACTGPVIAMETPRRGPRRRHLGVFDWLEVLRHEYAHTVTLSQTRNRVPHWLTEAAATSVELTPRDYATCQLLARSRLAGELLPLDEIDWAFVRPKRPTDRSLAYAQGRWMVEFMDEAHGPDALVGLLETFREGRSLASAFEAVLGVEPQVFERAFLEWSLAQVRAWGLDPVPAISDLLAAVGPIEAAGDSPGGSAISDELLAEWLEAWPTHPDLLEMTIRRRMRGLEIPPVDLEPLLEAYASARPVDPYPHRILARAYLASEDPLRAIDHLLALDRVERDDNTYAIELARLLRQAGRHGEAFTAISKAVRIDGYDAPLRELAAAIALEAGEIEFAHLHLRALLLLEPDRPIHRRRLEAFEQRHRAG